ncbi:MAG TPA: NB-ARC domain-containing protein [Micromonosporaceae bacterium]|nr:NB-ARC domain-containing protein [Micromonosporaceae bacterium]
MKGLLRPWVRGEARAALDADETDEGVWQARLGEELAESGAAEDVQVRAPAELLLGLADPAKAATYNITRRYQLRGGRRDVHRTGDDQPRESGPPSAAGDGIGSSVPGTPTDDLPFAATVQVAASSGAPGVFTGPVHVNGRAPIRWPHRVGVVPPLADCRQPRTVDTDLAAASASGLPVVVCEVVTGLGGVGKTQLAAALAHRCWDTNAVDLMVWVAASSRSRVLNAYAHAAADLAGVDDADQEQSAARLLAWLAGTDRRWLIVLDDLTDPADLRGVWPPAQTAVGRTVVTTRRRDASLLAGRQVVPVGLFAPEEARAY